MPRYRIDPNILSHSHDDEDIPINSTYPDTYKAPSTPNLTLRQLKSGKIPIHSTINLRGLYQKEAREQLQNLIQQNNKQSLYLIIHGKGLRSDNNIPKIKNLLLSMIYQHPKVIAYTPALAKDGGEGACYVLLGEGVTSL
ncbi:Smr/MutS family protein [Candidatus Synchoanobacter obligatus]|uniref:Smr/MutS family protein n=1 Tax=Candidatus Synchoanobacter obligatus TaxID=2919597 RepID=A0ABT1L496_9GAMM|nr:Smr/MutS family protein [Candidatus Synchoanobacter obligatus]MCP8351986.1 Smr/MutS family protein [Candidatus Synchoanobacter obligatus]